MRMLEKLMADFEKREQMHDFPGMSQCLLDSRKILYDMSVRSQVGALFLNRFLNAYLVCAFMALEQHEGGAALICLEAAEEGIWNIYRKRWNFLSYYKGAAYQELRQYDEAETQLRDYVNEEPQDETAYFRLGNIAYHQKQWSTALEMYGKALDIKKNYAEAMLNIGVIALHFGDIDTAETMSGDNEELRKRIFEKGDIEEDPGYYSLCMEDKAYLDIPIFINSRDRLGFLKKLVEWLLQAGYHNIYILDNASTYPPLLEYYKSVDEHVKVLFLKNNLGYKALWLSGILNELDIKTPYIYTDPDVVPIEDCPADFVKEMLRVLRHYPMIKKVGLGLKTDDITFSGKEIVLKEEQKWSTTHLTDTLIFGAVDTTMALYRNYRHYNIYSSIRLKGKYMARHLPWYLDYNRLPEDEIYYAGHASGDSSTLAMLREQEGKRV